MVITILSTDLLLQHNGEKSGAISRDVRKTAYSELPLSRRVCMRERQNGGSSYYNTLRADHS